MEVFTIKGLISGNELYRVEASSLKEALEKAVAAGAYLGGANLGGATILDGGESWESYLRDVVPALLTAGGKSLAEVMATGCWECHEWSNCPMHVALGIGNAEQAPVLLRPRVRQFVQLFDARLIPAPIVPEVGTDPSVL